jgi:chlorobactene glucosyltransferase
MYLFLEVVAMFIFYSLFAFSILVSILGIINLIFIRKPIIYHQNNSDALVSVLIPARNEENNIKRCLYSLIDQTYKNLEIIVLDDDSDDQTYDVVKNISKNYESIKLVKGKAKTIGWTGKNWACNQLSKYANGDFLLFVDADTKLQKNTITETVNEMNNNDIDLISLFPNRITNTAIDKIISVTIGWFIFSCLPIIFSNKNPIFSSAFGQFLLFRKGAYFSIGGHESIKDKILDDFELGRLITKKGYNLNVLDGTERISTFSYSTEKEALEGLSKSIFPFFNNKLVPFLILLILFLSMGLMPIFIMMGEFFGAKLTKSKEMIAYFIWGLLTLSWAISSYRSKQGIRYGVLYPFITTLTAIVGIFSIITFLTKSVNWKNRNIIQEETIEENFQKND